MMVCTFEWCDMNGTSAVFLPKTGNTCLIVGKRSDKFQLRAILQNSRPVLLNTVKVTKNKKSLRKCHS